MTETIYNYITKPRQKVEIHAKQCPSYPGSIMLFHAHCTFIPSVQKNADGLPDVLFLLLVLFFFVAVVIFFFFSVGPEL